MKTKELHDSDLDSSWTPVRNLFEFGLHLDSRLSLAIRMLLRAHARSKAPPNVVL